MKKNKCLIIFRVVWFIVLTISFTLSFFIDAHATEDAVLPICSGPKISPDGDKIVFTSDIDNTGMFLYLINSNGIDLKQINTIGGKYPTWSPDNSKIAFVSDGDIWIVDVEGTNLIRKTNDGFNNRNSFPTWSPDGSKIAFCDGAGDIALINIDGTNRKKLVSGNCPAWSPNGQQIAYLKQFNTTEGNIFFNIWTINIDGSNETQLTFGNFNDIDPAWSPDGSRIAFSSNRSLAGQDIWDMGSNGGGLYQLTHSGDGWSPSWGPDGAKIIFGSDNIKAVNVSTGVEQQITFFRGYSLPFSEFSLKHWRIHWDQGKHDKNKFHLSGRIDLPDDYTLDMLQKKGIVNIAIEKNADAPFSQTAAIDFKQHGPIWHYKAPKAQNGT